MSVLEGLTSAWLRQRRRSLWVASWILAVAGPALLTIAARPLHSSLIEGGFLFSALILVIAVAVVGGMRPALTALVLAILARVFFFGPPFASRSAGLPNMVSLIGFAIAGVAVPMLISKVGQLAAAQAALRRVATQVAHTAPAEEVFAAAAGEAGRLAGADYVRIGRFESGDLIGIAAWDRTAEDIRAGGRWSLIRGFTRAVPRIGRPVRMDDIASACVPLLDDARAHGASARWPLCRSRLASGRGA